MEFAQFCSCGPSGYAYLKQCVDACALQGRSYEFPQVGLPAGCRPGHADLGFWRVGADYFLYFRPQVAYQGASAQLAAFFSGGHLQHFSSFQALSHCLHQLDRDPSALRTAAAPASELFRRLKDDLSSVVVGQDSAIEAAAFKLCGHMGKPSPARPLSLMFYGPTCVGKSRLAKEIAPALNRLLGQERYRLVWTELNTFTEVHSVYRLTGAPPGYVGYDDPPVLEAVRHDPCTVFMFDELDKAHPEVLKVFMSILDEGRCTARQEDESGGRELDFRRCIFLFTTNADLSAGRTHALGFAPPGPAQPRAVPAASAEPASLAQRLFQADESARQALVRSGVLKEIAGRFSGLIGFQPLDRDAQIAVTAKQIAALGAEYGLNIVRVDRDLSRALTPEDALSLRSNVGVLEGVLTPVFLARSERSCSEPLMLTGTPDALLLRPAGAHAEAALC